jgi:ABC-type amino acid transport substrate-binding protein
MKKIICLLILSLIFLTGCKKEEEKNALEQIKEKDMLVVGINDDSKPFGFISKATGEYEGFDVDVARYIAKDILGSERKVKFVALDTSKRIEAITSGDVDMAIATMTVTPQRQYLIDFSIPCTTSPIYV